MSGGAPGDPVTSGEEQRSDRKAETPRTRIGEDRSSRGLHADLLPWADGSPSDGAVTITVYVVTGRHGIVRVPERFCRECHLFTRRAEAAADRVEADVSVRVRSWWTHFPWALLRGGYHPPVMVIGGSMLCQGHDVPTVREVTTAIKAEHPV